MKLKRVLESDWSDYDDLKKKKRDANYVSCSERWEIDYLVKKILEISPKTDEEKIRSAIAGCCGKVEGNKPREEFMRCVLNSLKLL